MTRIDIGIFAHNEARRIVGMLESLLRQDIFHDPSHSVQLHILANGCNDATVERARQAIESRGLLSMARLHDFPEGGKSRTWNRFVHDVSRPEADLLLFMDADITIPEPDMLRQLCALLVARPDLSGVSSRPVKDIVHQPSLSRGPLDALIAAAGGSLNDWKSAICGQLYLLRSNVARGFHLPIGLPVEDGFVRALVQTDRFRQEQTATALDGIDALYHVYPSERGLGALIRHQARIVIGSAINKVIYDDLRPRPPEEVSRHLAMVAQDPEWLGRFIGQKLPSPRYGYVPFNTVTKRFHYWKGSQDRLRPKRIAVMLAGSVFDTIVYLRSQYTMWRGKGAGYW